MTKRKSGPAHAIEVTTYEELRTFAAAFSKGTLNLLILIGRAGISKSQTMRSVVSDDVCWIESNATAYGIYSKLYQHQNQPVVIDDVDALYSDKAAVRLLKCLCQTDAVKNVAWHTAAAGAGTNVPREFQTTSQVCIIANDWKSLDANTAAVEDRGHLVMFDPPPEEVHREVGKWFWDQPIYDWFADHLHLMPTLSMRHYIRAFELRESGIDFVKVLLADSVSPKALLVSRIKADPAFSEERERVAEFERLGGGGQTTWYKWSKRIRAPHETSGLKVALTNPPPEKRQSRAA